MAQENLLREHLTIRIAEKSNNHIVSFDGLRGFASLAVFLDHAGSEGFVNLSNQMEGLGKIGVALFYTLSGFLMAHLYLTKAFSKFNIKRYFVARIARIVPLFYLAIIFGAFMLFTFEISIYGFNNIFQIVMNFLFIRGNGVLWSIAAEVQFYFIFVILWGATNRGVIWPVILLLIVAQQILILIYFSVNNTHSNILIYWLHYFVLGILINFLTVKYVGHYVKFKEYTHTGWIAASLLGIFLVIMPGSRMALGWEQIPIFFDPFVFFGVFLFVQLSFVERGPFAVLASPVMVWLGARSFGIYLFHVPTLLILGYFLPETWKSNGLSFGIVLIIVLATADILHRLVERPAGLWIRRRGGSL